MSKKLLVIIDSEEQSEKLIALALTFGGYAVDIKSYLVENEKKIITPLDLADFFPRTKERLDQLVTAYEGDRSSCVFVVGQRGFFKHNGTWSIAGATMMRFPNETETFSLVRSYQLPEEVSKAMDENPHDSSLRVAALKLWNPVWRDSQGMMTGIAKIEHAEKYAFKDSFDVCYRCSGYFIELSADQSVRA